MANLGYPGARILIDVPKANLIVTITGTEKIILLRVEVKGHHMWGMPCECLQGIPWLQG